MTPRALKWPLPLLAALALAAAGCSSTPTATTMPPNERTAEALRLSLRAQEAQKAGKADLAIDLYRRALELQPNMRGLWNNLGLLLMEKHAYLDAVAALKHETDLWPDDPVAYSNLGVAYFDAGFAEESLHYHELALERDPYHLDSLRGVAQASRRVNKANDKILDILRRGMMVEHEASWRSVFEAERLRVEGQMREQKETGRIRTPVPKS